MSRHLHYRFDWHEFQQGLVFRQVLRMPLYQIFLHFWITLHKNAHNFDLHEAWKRFSHSLH